MVVLMIFGGELKVMPFRVYEAGITYYSVPMIQGLYRQETLIRPIDVRSVNINTISNIGITPSHIDVKFQGPKSEQTMYLTHSRIDDPIGVMLAIHTVIPDKLDEKAYTFIDPDGEGPVVLEPEGERDRTDSRYLLFLFFLGLALFFSVYIGVLILPPALEMDLIPWLITPFLIIALGTIIMTYIIIRLAKSFFYKTLKRILFVHNNHLRYPHDPLLSMFINIRSSLPIDEVVEVRKSLSAGFYYNITLLRTSSNEFISTDFGIYNALKNHTDFNRSGVVLSHKAPNLGSTDYLTKSDWLKSLEFFSILTLVSILSGILAFLLRPHGISSPVAFETVSTYFILTMMIVMSILMFILIISKTREAKMLKTLFVSDKGISAPEAKNGLTWININEINSCSTYKTKWQYRIHIETDRGILVLPIAAYEKLTEGGVKVEDPCGIFPIKQEPSLSK